MSAEEEQPEVEDPPGADDLDARFVEALDRGRAGDAAAILRKMDGMSRHVREALADMLDGDPKGDETLVRRYPFRLQLTRWPSKRTRPPKNFRDFEDDMDLARAVSVLVGRGMSVNAAVDAVAKSNPKAGVSKVRKAYNGARRHLLHARKK